MLSLVRHIQRASRPSSRHKRGHALLQHSLALGLTAALVNYTTRTCPSRSLSAGDPEQGSSPEARPAGHHWAPPTMLFAGMLPHSVPLVAAACTVALCTAFYQLVRSLLVRLNTECQTSFSTLAFEDPRQMSRVPVPSIETDASKTLSVVFPAYNEESRLSAALDEALAFLHEKRRREGLAFSYEVIIVDDGSTDKTYLAAMKYVAKHGVDTVRVLRLPVNKGKGCAVKAGMQAARGQLLLFADADGATQFSDFQRLEGAIRKLAHEAASKQGPAAASCSIGELHGMVAGSRAHLEKTDVVAQRHWYRNVLMHGFHLLVMLVAGPNVHDTQCGFKLFTRRSARVLFKNMRLQRWCFDVELVFLANQMKIPIAEENVTWTEVPGSKIKPWTVLSMAFEMLLIKSGYMSGLWPVVIEQAM